jgi:hypothetical protein
MKIWLIPSTNPARLIMGSDWGLARKNRDESLKYSEMNRCDMDRRARRNSHQGQLPYRQSRQIDGGNRWRFAKKSATFYLPQIDFPANR